MSSSISRLRMFAGPNGSGKSTMINQFIKEKKEHQLGIYLNADDIEKRISEMGIFKFEEYSLVLSKEKILEYFNESELLKKENLIDSINLLRIEDNLILFDDNIINSYFSSVIVNIVRHELLEQNKSFTFETVMSSKDKVEFLEKAQKKGYRTYLYYIATDDPIINIMRVKNRVEDGGHSVPEEKIVSRYHRSLGLLKDAIMNSNRAFIFDSSSKKSIMFAITDEQELEFKVPEVPYWFMNALDLK